MWNSERFNRGEYQAAEYKRLAKGGREIWIEAPYNPILDLNGKPFKVVQYAADVTAKAVDRMKAERARGLIESVAAGSEKMGASIHEISETMMKSRRPRARRCARSTRPMPRRSGSAPPPKRWAESSN
jgi:methyl-accepting chemotaxis protein